MALFLTIPEAAKHLRISERMLRYHVERDGLPFIPVGKRGKRFREEDLDAWAAGRVSQLFGSQQEAPSIGAPSRSTASAPVSRQVLETLDRLQPRPRPSMRAPRSAKVRLPGGAPVLPLRPGR